MKDSIYYALDLVSNFASTYSPAPCEITAVTAVTVVIWFSILYSISIIGRVRLDSRLLLVVQEV